MKESKNEFGLFPSDVQKLKMAPPENAWSNLEAELDKKFALRNNSVSKPLQFAFIGVVLLISIITTYSCLVPVRISYITYGNEVKESQTKGINADNNIVNENKTESVKHPLQSKSFQDEKTSNGITAPPSKMKDKSISAQTSEISSKQGGKLMADKNQRRAEGNEKNETLLDKNETQKKEEPLKVSSADESPVMNSQQESKIEKETVSTKPVDSENAVTPTPANVESKEPVALNKDDLKGITPANSKVGKEGKSSRFFIAAYYAPNYTRNHLVENGSVPSENVTEYYSHEQGKYAFSAGLNIGYDLNKHWSLVTGGIYSTLSYATDLPVIYAGYGANDELHYRYPTSCGTIIIPDQGTSLKKGDSLNLNTSCAQVIKFITIPLTIRYRLPVNRFSFYAYTGLSVNFAIRSNATLNLTPGGSGPETQIINNVEGIKKLNYGYLFGAGVQYNFANGLGIFMEPSYRGSINSLTENLSVDCYPYSFGLNTGISLHF